MYRLILYEYTVNPGSGQGPGAALPALADGATARRVWLQIYVRRMSEARGRPAAAFVAAFVTAFVTACVAAGAGAGRRAGGRARRLAGCTALRRRAGEVAGIGA
ncbi:hypothetical protein CBM2634_B190107 [Cupriavidus taiwanensis]|uniref:Uncharacterized protein n=1 Tax=Cupriavidus taiwanensis TaxID=164546 RepID=A0A375JBD2_9BURK|nr:hypothetical protein CBM2634_B190107 [Cupriavidus taiwanensis]